MTEAVQPVDPPVLYERYRLKAGDFPGARMYDYGDTSDLEDAKRRANGLWKGGAGHIQIICESAFVLAEHKKDYDGGRD